MHSWNIFGAWMSHKHTRTHKTHHSPNVGEATTFPLIVFFMISHRGYIQMSFCLKIRIFVTLEAHNFFSNLWLRWGLKQSCSPRQELSNDMWHTTYTQVNEGFPTFFLGHNLCFKYSNGMCEPILTSTFQELSNNMRNSSMQWVLAPTITLWRFGSLMGLQFPKW
jgi:hypothetical protein